MAPRSAAATLAAVLLAIVACAPETPALRIGTSGDYPPFSLDGEGFDIEVATRFAEHLDRDVEWVPFRWPELSADVEADRFDIAMSGVTWRPARDVGGWLSLAVARGGPCVVGPAGADRLAVNRGGILEAWTRERFPERSIVTTDDNRSLPDLLREGTADGFVTDRFEVRHFAAPDDEVRCEPATDRKVYWVAPRVADELGPALDEWLRANEAALGALREEYFGASAPLDPVDHVVDLIGRRLELMPAVAAWKRAHGVPLEDLERERVVLERSTETAVGRGLDGQSVQRLFRLQIELAKGAQSRSEGTAPSLDLESELRPAILRLGDRLVEALALLETPVEVSRDRFELLSGLLDETEIESLAAALGALCTADARALGRCA